MAMNDAGVLTAAVGYILTATVDQAAPTPQQIYDFDPGTGLSGWTLIGHTSRDELPEFGFDGGDSEVKGSWQNAALKTVVTETAVDFVTFTLIQMDEAGFAWYYGVTDASPTNGVVDVATPGGEIQKALLIVIVDGTNKVANHASKVGIRRDDSISLAVDDFGALPLRATYLSSPGKPRLSWVIGIDSTP